jgi:hypothetical protein
MADLGGDFDAEQVDPAKDFDALPVGRYPVMITESEKVDNSSGKGWHIKLVMQVLDGPFKGRNIWHRLNLDNPNTTAVQISRGQLSSICRAVKVLKPRDSSELHNLPFVVRVSIREHDNKKYNDCEAFYPPEGSGETAKPAATGKPSGPAKPATSASDGAAPWETKAAS